MNSFWAFLAPTAMLSVGGALQAKDTNRTGNDDTIGQMLVAFAPAVQAALDGNTNTAPLRRAMTTIRDAAQGWLDANPLP